MTMGKDMMYRNGSEEEMRFSRNGSSNVVDDDVNNDVPQRKEVYVGHVTKKPKRFVEVLKGVIRSTRYRNGLRRIDKTEPDCWRLVIMMEDMM